MSNPPRYFGRNERRWFLKAAAFLTISFLLWKSWHSTPIIALRTWASSPRGYEGCQCADCASAYGLPVASAWLQSWERDAFTVGCGLIVALLLAWLLTPPCAWLFRLKEKKQDPSRCGACGYDIRGLRSEVCPECGALLNPPYPLSLWAARTVVTNIARDLRPRALRARAPPRPVPSPIVRCKHGQSPLPAL